MNGHSFIEEGEIVNKAIDLKADVWHKDNRYRIILGIVLFAYAAFCSRRGVDVSDTTYALGNYQYMDQLDSMWIIATFLSNVFGRLMLSLPGAGTLYGVTVYATCLFAVFIEIMYLLFSKYITYWVVFVSEILAVSLCWAPKVIFYNYITYCMMAFAILIIVYSLMNSKPRYLIVAGIILGINVFVRFSNAIECLIILGLWLYEILEHHKISEFIKKTVYCIAGYIIGFFIPFIFVVIKYDLNTYFDMIHSLFAMTETASDYSGAGVFRTMRYMILDTFHDMKYLVGITIFFVFLSLVMYLITEKINKDGITAKVLNYLLRFFNVLALLGICIFFFKKGVYTTNYYEYSSIFKCANMFIVLAFVLNVLNACGKFKCSSIFRALSLMSIVQMIIAPIGTNNHMYAIMNNMFITAPTTFAIIYRVYALLREKKYGFVIYSFCGYIVAVVLIQSTIFHLNFSYVDGTDGSNLNTIVSNIDNLRGSLTTDGKAKNLEGLYGYLKANDMLGQKALLFGRESVGLAFAMGLEPAIDTLWPDLDSYTVSKFEDSLSKIEGGTVIIMSEELTFGANVDIKKQMLSSYIDENGYAKVFENSMYTLYYVQ